METILNCLAEEFVISKRLDETIDFYIHLRNHERLNHATLNYTTLNNETCSHVKVNHETLGHATLNHEKLNHAIFNHKPLDHEKNVITKQS